MPVVNKGRKLEDMRGRLIPINQMSLYMTQLTKAKGIIITPDQFMSLKSEEWFWNWFDPNTLLRYVEKGFFGIFNCHLLDNKIKLEVWVKEETDASN